MLLVVLATVGATAPGAAQTAAPGAPSTPPPSSEPFQGLFGSSSRDQSLVLNASIYGGYDDNVLVDQAGGLDPGRQESGGLGGGDLGLSFSKTVNPRFSFGASGKASGRYYPNGGLVDHNVSYGGGLAFDARLSRYTRLTVTENLSYQPFYQLSLFPGLEEPVLGGPPPSNLDYVVSDQSGWLTDTLVTLDRQLGAHSSLRFLGGVYRSDFGEATEETFESVLTTYLAGAEYLRSVRPGLGLRLGYRYRKGSFGITNVNTRDVNDHQIDAGVDYKRALTRSGRTTLTFSTGSSIVDADGERHFQVIGHANLAHQLTRSWFASLRYGRDVGYVGNFSTALFSDNLSVGVNGLIGRRLALIVNGGLSRGTMGFEAGTSSEFSTYTASAMAQYALNAFLAAYVQYSYFDYDFPQANALQPVNGRLSRDGVRVGLSLTLPLAR